jgi:hypothetical protein
MKFNRNGTTEKSVSLRSSRAGGRTRTAEAQAAGAEAGVAPEAVGRPRERRGEVPTATPEDTIGASICRPHRINHRLRRVSPSPVEAPLPHIAQHVVASPRIRHFLTDWLRLIVG